MKTLLKSHAPPHPPLLICPPAIRAFRTPGGGGHPTAAEGIAIEGVLALATETGAATVTTDGDLTSQRPARTI